mmetsp:Transcript_32068/g.31370  ORF Transcript_32068/g.31370 Transcript_32068/m.31370 type:complete len:117 (-) Transcript_32068:1188-1538(-)
MEEGSHSHRFKASQQDLSRKQYETTFTPFQQYMVANGQENIISHCEVKGMASKDQGVRRVNTLAAKESNEQVVLPELNQPMKANYSDNKGPSTSQEKVGRSSLLKNSPNLVPSLSA